MRSASCAWNQSSLGDPIGLPRFSQSRVYAPAQFGKFRFRNIHRKRTNRILVRCLLAASLCASGLGHGVLLCGLDSTVLASISTDNILITPAAIVDAPGLSQTGFWHY